MKARGRGVIELLLYSSGPVAALVTTPFLARALGVEDRGVMGVILAISSLAITIANWGQAEVYLADARNGTGDPKGHLRLVQVGGLATGLVVLGVLTVSGFDPFAAFVAAAAVPLLAKANMWRSITLAARNTELPARANLVASLLRLMFLPLLAILSLLTLPVALAVNQLGLAASAYVTTGRFARKRTWGRASSSTTSLVRKLSNGSKIILFGLLTSVVLNGSTLFMQAISTPTQVGIFAACFALSQSALAVSGAFKSRIQAAVFEKESRSAIGREFAFLMIVAVCGAGAVAVAADPLTLVLLGPEFAGSAAVLRVLALATVGQLLLDSVQGLLVAIGLRSILLKISALGALIAAIGFFLLIPAGGALGAAGALSIAFWVSATAGLLLALRHYRKGDMA